MLNRPTANQNDPHMVTKLRRAAKVDKIVRTNARVLTNRTAEIKAEVEKALAVLNS